jgi:hypothetical protein
VEFNGEKEEKEAEVRQAVRTRVKEKKLTPEEKRELRRKMVSEKSAKAGQPEKKEKTRAEDRKDLNAAATAVRRAQELDDRVSFIADEKGAYQAAWDKYRFREPGPLYDLMKPIAAAADAVTNVTTMVRTADEVTPEMVVELDAMEAYFDAEVMSRINAVDKALRDQDEQRQKDEGTAAPLADALTVLNGLESLCDKEQWQKAVGLRMKGKVVGSSEVIARLTSHIEQYVKSWTGLKSDGLKGVPYGSLRKLAEARMEIVTTIAESGETFLMACCRPGTDFYQYIGRLAAQSCSSSDVQNFVGWWEKNKQITG